MAHRSAAGVLHSLLEANPDAIVLYDVDGSVVDCNDAALALSGYDRDLLTTTHYRDHVYHKDFQRAQEMFALALSGSTAHLETTVRSKDGTIIPVEIYAFPAREGDRVVGVFVQARDTVALRAAERSLTLNQERFRSLFEYHPDAVMALRADGSISRVNVALEAATGYYGEQIINKPWTDLVPPECRKEAEAAFSRAARGEVTEFESFLLDRLGNRIDAQFSVVPLRAGEQIQGSYVIAKNVVAQRSAERAMRLQSERIRDLYLVAAAQESGEAQLDGTLALGCRIFGFDHGYITRFDGEVMTVVNSVGEGTIPTGSIYPREQTFSRHLTGERKALFIPNLDEEPWAHDPARRSAPWRSYFGIKLVVNNQDYGALAFAGRLPHTGLNEDLDRDLFQLMALFAAAAIERAQHAERIEQLAFFDALTGLPNRVLFEDRLRQALAAARRYNRGFAVMYLDLDDFKSVNDRFGHPAGDLVLKNVADRLSGVLRESDTVARFGGDEFVVLQPVVNGAADAADLARKIVNTLQEPIVSGEVHQSVHTSIGIALFPQDGDRADALMDRADRALYRAKHEGRNRWLFFNTDVPRSEWPAKAR